MGQFVEDFEDLKAVQPAASATAPAVTTPVATAAPATTTTPVQPQTKASAEVEDAPVAGTPAAAQTSNDFNVEFGDEDMMSRSDGLDLLRPDKGKTVRFALLTEFVPAKKAFNHFIDKKGSYHCLSTRDKHQVVTGEPAVCCQQLGESQPQVVALVLHYTNANPKTGRYDKDPTTQQYPPIQWEIRFIRLSRSGFRRISNLTEEDGKPTDIDITMCHRDSGVGYEYNKVSVARWKKNPDLVKEVQAALKPFADGKKLLGKLGKKVGLLEMKAVLAGTRPAGNGEADLNQIDDI